MTEENINCIHSGCDHTLVRNQKNIVKSRITEAVKNAIVKIMYVKTASIPITTTPE